MTEDELEAKYRLLFLSEMGQTVLTDILVNLCGFGTYMDRGNDEQVGTYNVGLKIIGRLGLLKDAETLVRAMLSATPGARLVIPVEGDKNAGT